MTNRPQTQDDNLSPMMQTYLAITVIGVAITVVLAVAALCLGPTMGLAVRLYTDISGG